MIIANGRQVFCLPLVHIIPNISNVSDESDDFSRNAPRTPQPQSPSFARTHCFNRRAQRLNLAILIPSPISQQPCRHYIRRAMHEAHCSNWRAKNPDGRARWAPWKSSMTIAVLLALLCRRTSHAATTVAELCTEVTTRNRRARHPANRAR